MMDFSRREEKCLDLEKDLDSVEKPKLGVFNLYDVWTTHPKACLGRTQPALSVLSIYGRLIPMLV